MSTLIVEVHDLCFSYSGKEVLHGVDLSVDQGDFVAVVGPNGGGKTTLVKLIIGLLKPTRGTVKLTAQRGGAKGLKSVMFPSRSIIT